MKKRMLAAAGIMMLVFLTACGTNDTTEQEEPTDEVTEETNNTETDETTNNETTEDDTNVETETNGDGEMESQAAELNFVEISIDISYGPDQDFEVSLGREDDDHDRVDADIEDEINNVFFEGREAFDHIFPKLEPLDLTAETTEEEAIEQVLNAFDLAADYEEFELEVDFEDGSKLDFEHRQ